MTVQSFTPASSNVDRVSFDDTTDTLTVEFSGGRAYDVLNCPAAVYRGFQAAPSAGEYYHRNIKGRYNIQEA